MKIRLGQIGIGHNHGEAKLLAARKFPELFEVVGVAEENEEWVQRRGGLKGYQGLPRLSVPDLISRCDALLIESDVWDLDRFARMAVEAGKHIHLDKPAGDPQTFADTLHLAEQQGLTVQMGYMYRYNPAIRKCLELVESGALGEIYAINAEMSTCHSPAYKRWLTNFRGGAMYILGSHLVDLIVYILGRPMRVTSFLPHTGADGVDLPDNNLAVLEYEKAIAKVTVSSVEVNGWGRRSFTVAGSRGTVHIMPIENRCSMTYSDVSIATNPYEDMYQPLPVQDIPKDCRYDDMMRDFAAYIRGEKENPFSYAHDALVQQVIAETVGGVCFYGNRIV